MPKDGLAGMTNSVILQAVLLGIAVYWLVDYSAKLTLTEWGIIACIALVVLAVKSDSGG